MDERVIKQIVEDVLEKRLGRQRRLSVGVSNRHLHLSQNDLQVLFGANYELAKLKDLVQTGQFAAKETVTLIGPKGIIEGVRILGPVRKITQVEVLRSDCFRLGIAPVVRESGDLVETPGLVVAGPNGVLHMDTGVIVAKCHIHADSATAKRWQVEDGGRVQVSVSGERKVVFHDVLVRVHSSFKPEFHVDMDEANAACLNNLDEVLISGER